MLDLESVIQSEVRSEKQISCINANTWNLEKWYRGTYFHGRSRDEDVENRPVDMELWGREGGTNWEIKIDIYTHV